MGDSKGGESRFAPFSASKSFAFAQHINKKGFPRFSAGIPGEAANKLVRHHDEFVKHYPDVPWEDMYWMRNRISHGYFSIDFEIVWKTIEQDLPVLQDQIQNIYKRVI